ncbi:GNAT family N-acetyltransferase [Nocardioides sp. zg-1228]|uniref:GNAT family N-acetyltransferase n=1 Tax=Nocardioides sp. zg-1228 TaxID=2763008 RepID=UPI001642E29B|nr:GNAT family N-acetyltransferase [Nocardioides sp. zg-1228]MBC2934229.1 GNAT family N-acetyltransferase [Nocardioides sp. zg-1228]QSF59011.1 GNAT family N-acetyltransferase [Nocardioides sp. zg-1228]
MTVPTIRPAHEADMERLVDVEVKAGQLFHTVGMSQVAEDVPDRSDLREAIERAQVWVAQFGAEIAAYITAEVLDGNAHVAQVSVAPAYAGRRIGRALLEFVEAWGRDAGLPATTLTTFRDVPWNGPYYLRLGYRVLASNHVGPELARAMAHEASLPGIDASLRCAMIKPNHPPAVT